MIKHMQLLIPLAISIGLVACRTTLEDARNRGIGVIAQSDATQASTSTPINITTTGEMKTNETWQGSVLLTGDVIIPAEFTLTITPGTTVEFTAKSDDNPGCRYDPDDITTNPCTMISINVFGKLDAQGTSGNPITFTSTNPYPKQETMDYQGISVMEYSEIILDHVIMEYGHFGLQFFEGAYFQASIKNSIFRDISKCAICAAPQHTIHSPLMITNCRFIRARREAVDTYKDQNIILNNNVFKQNRVAIMSVGSSILIENNRFILNERGIGVVEKGTPTITGNIFELNPGPAIFVVDSSPIIKHNNFIQNALHISLENYSTNLLAEWNWWSSIDAREIAKYIKDGKDHPDWVGIVIFEPFAESPFDLDIPED